jgi:predicted glycoside hydrolase/deacetylase ChbG (UPF0249 family)
VKRLIVNADDMGLHRGINEGILRCYREGIVTSVSVCANGVAFEEAAAGLKGSDGPGVGVHLTLVGERALCPAPSLAPEGRLPGYFTGLFRRLMLGQIPEIEIERELAAQISRVRDAGLRVTHLDSHQHVHLHPRLLPTVVCLAQRFDIGALRVASCLTPLAGVRSVLVSAFARRARVRIPAAGLRTPDALIGIGETGRLDERRLLELLRRVPPGTTELVCHPGIESDGVASAYPWGFGWDREVAALTSPRVRAAVDQERVRLISYSEL